MPARQLASLGTAGQQEIELGDRRATCELSATNVTCVRRPSLAPYKCLLLDYPATIFTLTMNSKGTISPPTDDYLVGAGETPSFPTFASAFNAFFFDNFAVTGTTNPPLGELLICFSDERARIRRVQVGAAALVVTVDGHSLADAQLELNGAQYRTTVELDERESVSLPLPRGLPADAWLWLKTGSQWLDYRPLTLNFPGSHPSPDIEFEVREDPATTVSRLATQGEGPKLEYKSKLPGSDSEKRTVFKTVVAFSNGGGGMVLFGVADDGEICGLTGKPDEEQQRLNDLLRDLVSPAPKVEIAMQEIDGHTVLILTVGAGEGTLYALILNRNKPEYYVRRAATTYYARPEELEAIIKRADI